MKTKDTFDKSLTRLEEIIEILENGSCPLEEAMSLFEEGVKISASCNNTLEKAKQKVTTLSQAESERETNA